MFGETSDTIYQPCALEQTGKLRLARGQLPEAAGFFEQLSLSYVASNIRWAKPTRSVGSTR